MPKSVETWEVYVSDFETECMLTLTAIGGTDRQLQCGSVPLVDSGSHEWQANYVQYSVQDTRGPMMQKSLTMCDSIILERNSS